MYHANVRTGNRTYSVYSPARLTGKRDLQPSLMAALVALPLVLFSIVIGSVSEGGDDVPGPSSELPPPFSSRDLGYRAVLDEVVGVQVAGNAADTGAPCRSLSAW